MPLRRATRGPEAYERQRRGGSGQGTLPKAPCDSLFTRGSTAAAEWARLEALAAAPPAVEGEGEVAASCGRIVMSLQPFHT